MPQQTKVGNHCISSHEHVEPGQIFVSSRLCSLCSPQYGLSIRKRRRTRVGLLDDGYQGAAVEHGLCGSDVMTRLPHYRVGECRPVHRLRSRFDFQHLGSQPSATAHAPTVIRSCTGIPFAGGARRQYRCPPPRPCAATAGALSPSESRRRSRAAPAACSTNGGGNT